MEQLRESIRDYSDQYLLEQYLKHQEEYTPEALEIIKEEIRARDLESGMEKPQTSADAPVATLKLDSADFTPFEHTFSHTDILLAIAMLRDNKVLFYVDNHESSDILPLESEASKRFSIHVHKEHVNRAHDLIDEHFSKSDTMYLLKHTSAKDRLRAFNFHDLHLTEFEAAEMLDVVFAKEESSIIISYGTRLLTEAEQIEQQLERVLFYYDCIEDLVRRLQSGVAEKLSRTDLLTILEILQVYSDDEAFPSLMDEAIVTLLGFFTGG